ncbi:unnamed protein product [Prorocentrum cordatum]|uniref:EF-hand domain-containing protein n=1 Tax=Prorocentrum cordatum TaxID=2364126 RepID=A0ABN9VRV0_9DINO|nr:unnamed protein product [Polarella glacialis]
MRRRNAAYAAKEAAREKARRAAATAAQAAAATAGCPKRQEASCYHRRASRGSYCRRAAAPAATTAGDATPLDFIERLHSESGYQVSRHSRQLRHRDAATAPPSDDALFDQIANDVRTFCTVTADDQRRMVRAYSAKMDHAAPLPGCGSCGRRDPAFPATERVRLENLPPDHWLFLTPDECRDLDAMPAVTFCEADGSTRTVETKSIRSYVSIGASARLHLHPELTRTMPDGGHETFLCESCARPLSDPAEALALADVRLYSLVAKIHVPGQRSSAASRSVLKGHMIAFVHDGPTAIEAQFNAARLRNVLEHIQVVYVGNTDRVTNLERHALSMKSVQMRPHVLYNHLSLRRALGHVASTDASPPIADIAALLADWSASLSARSRHADTDDVEEAIRPSDIANVRDVSMDDLHQDASTLPPNLRVHSSLAARFLPLALHNGPRSVHAQIQWNRDPQDTVLGQPTEPQGDIHAEATLSLDPVGVFLQSSDAVAGSIFDGLVDTLRASSRADPEDIHDERQEQPDPLPAVACGRAVDGVADVLREYGFHAGNAAKALRDMIGHGVKDADPDDAEHVKALLSNPVIFKHACQEQFHSFDVNGDGVLQLSEVVELTSSLYRGFGLDPPSLGSVQAFIHAMDANNDGVLDEREFRRFFEIFLRYAFFDVVKLRELVERGVAQQNSRKERTAAEPAALLVQAAPARSAPSPGSPKRQPGAPKPRSRAASARRDGGRGAGAPPRCEPLDLPEEEPQTVRSAVSAGHRRGTTAPTFRCIAPDGVAFRPSPDAASGEEVASALEVPAGGTVQALEVWIRTPCGWLPVMDESGGALFQRRSSGRARPPPSELPPAPPAAGRLSAEARPPPKVSFERGCTPVGLGAALAPHEEAWGPVVERLCARFPDAGRVWVLQALRDSGGHAGKAAAALREL